MLSRVAVVSVSAAAAVNPQNHHPPRILSLKGSSSSSNNNKGIISSNPLKSIGFKCNFNSSSMAAASPSPSRADSTFAIRASAQPLQNADELIDSVETFIFDCDGISVYIYASCICVYI